MQLSSFTTKMSIAKKKEVINFKNSLIPTLGNAVRNKTSSSGDSPSSPDPHLTVFSLTISVLPTGTSMATATHTKCTNVTGVHFFFLSWGSLVSSVVMVYTLNQFKYKLLGHNAIFLNWQGYEMQCNFLSLEHKWSLTSFWPEV